MIELKTKDEFIGFLMNFKSVATVTLVTRTAVKMNKKDVATKQIPNPTTEAWKVSMFVGEINADYEDKVNDARMLEGTSPTFEKGEKVWGEFVSKSLEKHGDTYYLKIIPGKSVISPVYEDPQGNAIDYATLEPFVPKAKPKPVDETNQGLEKPVIWRTYKLDSIAKFSIPGVVEYVAS